MSYPPTEPRNVLYLTPSVRLLGARRSLLSLVTHLDRSRWRPIVCGQTTGDLSDALADLDIPFEVVKTGWWRKGKYFLWRPFAISQIANLIRRRDIALVHCNEIYPNPFAIRACEGIKGRTGRKIPVLTHMRLTATPRQIRNYELRRSDLVITPSHEASRDFEVWPDKEERVRVVYNGVDLNEFCRSREKEAAREAIGLPRDIFLMGVIGQIGPRKGGDTVLEAFSRISADHPKAHLLFIGNTHRGQEEFADKLRAQANTPDLADRVHFFPFTKNILPYYEALDLNLLVSTSEGFGRTVIEAGAMGVPSIGARVGGIPEVIDHDNTGWLVEVGQADELSRRMREFIESEQVSRAMADSVFRHVAQNFSIRSHVDQITSIYDEFSAQASLE